MIRYKVLKWLYASMNAVAAASAHKADTLAYAAAEQRVIDTSKAVERAEDKVFALEVALTAARSGLFDAEHQAKMAVRQLDIESDWINSLD